MVRPCRPLPLKAHPAPPITGEARVFLDQRSQNRLSSSCATGTVLSNRRNRWRYHALLYRRPRLCELTLEVRFAPEGWHLRLLLTDVYSSRRYSFGESFFSRLRNESLIAPNENCTAMTTTLSPIASIVAQRTWVPCPIAA